MRDECAVRVFVLDYLRHGPCRTRRPPPRCLVAVRLHSRGDRGSRKALGHSGQEARWCELRNEAAQLGRHLVGKASACTSIHRHCQRRQRRVISRDNMENFSGQSRTHSDQRGNSMTIGKPFQKGHSGNPGGRPKVVAEVKELARTHTGKAIETLVSIMTNPKAAPAARVLLQTHYLIEDMGSRRSTSLVRAGLLTSFACQSPARQRRSGSPRSTSRC